MKKILIYYAIKNEIDFGLISKEWRKGSLKVPMKEWEEYLSLRMAFEIAHDGIFRKLTLKQRREFNALPYDASRKD